MIVNQADPISFLQSETVIPFVADDNVIAACEETLGDGTLQAYVQQLEAAFAKTVYNLEDDDDPGMSLAASQSEKADGALLVDETDDLH